MPVEDSNVSRVAYTIVSFDVALPRNSSTSGAFSRAGMEFVAFVVFELLHVSIQCVGRYMCVMRAKDPSISMHCFLLDKIKRLCWLKAIMFLFCYYLMFSQQTWEFYTTTVEQ